jgi:hypothetical protein
MTPAIPDTAKCSTRFEWRPLESGNGVVAYPRNESDVNKTYPAGSIKASSEVGFARKSVALFLLLTGHLFLLYSFLKEVRRSLSHEVDERQ